MANQTTDFALLYDFPTAESLDSFINSLKEKTGSSTLDWFSACGRDGIQVSNDEKNLVPIIIQEILDRGYHLYINDGSQVTLFPGQKYSKEEVQWQILYRYIDFEKKMSYNGEIIRALESYLELMDKQVLDPQYWLIEDGLIWLKKATKTLEDQNQESLVKEFVEKYPAKIQWMNLTRDINFYEGHLGNKRKYQDISPDEQIEILDKINLLKKQLTHEEQNMCSICFENPIETMVLPCMHGMACRACSDKLKGTENEDKCIYCRQKIEEILYEENSD